MPIDVSGFSTPQNQYEGLFKIGDDIRRNSVFEYAQKEREKAKKLSGLKYFL